MVLASWVAAPGQAKKQEGATCADCHKAQALPQPATQMGQAMQLPGHNTVLDGNPKLSFRKGAFSYSVETKDGKSVYQVTDGTQTVTVPIKYAMGAQAQTWVLERDGQLYESLVSFYPSIKGLDITTGDERIAPQNVDEAMGRPMSNEEAKVCFGCHATHAVMEHKLNLTALKPGVTCEHCHLESSAHLAAIVADSDSVPIPEKLGKKSAEDISNFCGQCHRTWETVVRSRWRGEADVRFQPYRLANSKCYNGTDARISCIGCHNPHEQVVHDAAYYDGKCLACHSVTAVATFTGAAVHPKVCPVAKANCASCHMPKVPLPNGHLRFTDHEIRVVKANEAYPN